MPKPNDWCILAHNIAKRAAVSVEDADLADRYTWTYTKNKFVNGYIGYLHRVVMARMIGEDVPSDQLVLPIDGNFANCTRNNLQIIAKEQWQANRISARQAKKLGAKIRYMQLTGFWQVITDGSLHTTEDAAIAHLLHK